jgi:hypothetical protein
MRYKISDIDRTLLSAYMDGELAPAETARAETLLASSEEARNYLRELRAVDNLSGQVLAASAATVVAGAPLAASFAAKLTGSAITAAAERAVVAKAVTLGSWGLAAVVGVAATVAVGAALVLQTPKGLLNPRQGKVAAHVAPQIAQPVSNLDTNNLIVPPMTAADMLAFAVHGMLPIDAKRNRFITLASKGADSLSVKVHHEGPRDIEQNVASIDLRERNVLDSIQRVIRTSLIYSNQGLAIRSDIARLIPSCRLGVIRTFQQAAPRLSVDLRQRLDRTRTELVAVERALDANRRTSVILDGNLQAVYRMIPFNGILVRNDDVAEENDDNDDESNELVLSVNSEPVFMVDAHALGVLQARAQMQMPAIPAQLDPAVADSRRMDSRMESNPAGERPRKVPVPALPPANVTTVSRAGAGMNGSPVVMTPEGDMNNFLRQPMEMTLRIRKNDTLMMQALEALRQAQEHLDKVDSMMRMRMQRHGNNGNADQQGDVRNDTTPNMEINGNGLELRSGNKVLKIQSDGSEIQSDSDGGH